MEFVTIEEENALNDLIEYNKKCEDNFKIRYEFNESDNGGYIKNNETSEIHRFNTERGLKRILTKLAFHECVKNGIIINKYAAFKMIRGYKW